MSSTQLQEKLRVPSFLDYYRRRFEGCHAPGGQLRFLPRHLSCLGVPVRHLMTFVEGRKFSSPWYNSAILVPGLRVSHFSTPGVSHILLLGIPFRKL